MLGESASKNTSSDFLNSNKYYENSQNEMMDRPKQASAANITDNKGEVKASDISWEKHNMKGNRLNREATIIGGKIDQEMRVSNRLANKDNHNYIRIKQVDDMAAKLRGHLKARRDELTTALAAEQSAHLEHESLNMRYIIILVTLFHVCLLFIHIVTMSEVKPLHIGILIACGALIVTQLTKDIRNAKKKYDVNLIPG